jgi:preprotein translocase subunit SecY
VVYQPGWSFRDDDHHPSAGTGFLMWLGEQISERGIGNGISMLIFAGIVARLPPPSAPPCSSCARVK